MGKSNADLLDDLLKREKPGFRAVRRLRTDAMKSAVAAEAQTPDREVLKKKAGATENPGKNSTGPAPLAHDAEAEDAAAATTGEVFISAIRPSPDAALDEETEDKRVVWEKRGQKARILLKQG